MEFRTTPAIVMWVLLAALAATEAAEPKAKRLPNPPNTDFSAFEKRIPWTLSEDFLRTETARYASVGRHENLDESNVVPLTLPELFPLSDGRIASTPALWERERREELLKIFRREVYGVAPARPTTLAFQLVSSDPQALNGQATYRKIALRFQFGNETFQFHLSLFVPNRRPGPVPVFLLLNHRTPDNTDPTRQVRSEFWPVEYAIARGYAMAAINVDDEVDPDTPNASAGVRAFYRRLHPAPGQFTWGTLAAWAWSGSRAVDYFETDPDIDRQRIAVIGHSRGGKTALWAAAQDSRFALACVNCAGEGGPALSRRNFGETLGMITTNFPHWFTPTYARYADKVGALPIDQHQLVALVAPRGYHGADAAEDLHADPRGSWLSLVEASKVWAMHGRARTWTDPMPLVNELRVDGPLAYHIRTGNHALTTFDWKLHFDHADALFRR